MPDSIEGTIVYQRSERGCFCCEGGHVFCRYLQLPGDPPPYSATEVRTASDFFNEWMDAHRGSEFEGRRVRISVELLPVAAPSAAPGVEEERDGLHETTG